MEFKDTIDRNKNHFGKQADFAKTLCNNIIAATTPQLIEFYTYETKDLFSILIAICFRYNRDIFEYGIDRCIHFKSWHLPIIQKIFAAKSKIIKHASEKFNKLADPDLAQRESFIYEGAMKREFVSNHSIFFSYRISNTQYIIPIASATTSEARINGTKCISITFTTQYQSPKKVEKLSFMFDPQSIMMPIHSSSIIYRRGAVLVGHLTPDEYQQLITSFQIG